ncbi:Pre-mRNA splicing factor-domain-containing protein [Lipomyces chichibuensis]|uniref:Pre-mRNA splicing factor-domain-containing protein n=1 Tax=Lipomyces chichibuensis TaxID=1546026 RepID=UPI0033438F59
MGGDLNLKKSWHPGLMRNQEAVWKREQEALEERKKIAERQREIQEERERNELQALQEAAGGKKRVDRVEWMYSAPQGGNMGVTSEVEAFLMGKNTVEELLNQSEGMGSLKEEADSFMKTASSSNSSKDIASKVREDPMLVVKKEQQALVNAIRNNPQRLKELMAMRERREPTSRIEKMTSRNRNGSNRSGSVHISRDEKYSSRSSRQHHSHDRDRERERNYDRDRDQDRHRDRDGDQDRHRGREYGHREYRAGDREYWDRDRDDYHRRGDRLRD